MNFLPTWSGLPKKEKICVAMWLIMLASIGAYFSIWATTDGIVRLVAQIGLATLMVSLAITGYSIFSLLQERCVGRSLTSVAIAVARGNRAPITTWAVCVLLAITAFPAGNRILMDEVIVLSTSKAIHEEREPVTPTFTQSYSGVHKLSGAYVDKRPYLYATIVSFFHDLLGYSPKNAFYANMFLGALTLALVGYLGRQLGGYNEAGMVAMVGLTSIPLFCEHVSGGGIDIVNLFSMTLLLALAMVHRKNPTVWSGTAMLGAGVMLAYSRYESLLFMAVPGVVMLLLLRERKQLFIGGMTLPYAAALLPLFGIHFTTFSHSADSFQLADAKVTEAFSVNFIPDNLAHALNFFLNTEHLLTNSPVVFIVGVIAVLLVAVAAGGRLVRREHQVVGAEYFAFGMVSLVGFGLLMAYSWGKVDLVVASRLTLPLYLFFILSVTAALHDIKMRLRYASILMIILAASFYWSCFPIAAKLYGFKVYTGAMRHAMFDEFIAAQPDKHYAVLNSVTNFWLTRDVYAVSPASLKNNPGFVNNMLKSGEFRRVYLIQVLQQDEKTGEFTVTKNDQFDLPFETQLVTQDVITGDQKIRVALLKSSVPPKSPASERK